MDLNTSFECKTGIKQLIPSHIMKIIWHNGFIHSLIMPFMLAPVDLARV